MENEEKMSEDDSSSEEQGDLLAEEDQSSSDEESGDEEIKLNESFIGVLAKIAEGSKNYEEFVMLLDIAHNLNDLDKIRQSVELFANEFPLSPEIWLKYLKIEVSIAQTEEELTKLKILFQRAIGDYYSIDVALEYAEFASKCSDKMASEIWDDLLPAFGYEFTKGRQIWAAWRKDYQKREKEGPERDRKILKRFKEELLLPLNDMKLTYVEYREFAEKLDSELQNSCNSIEEETKHTKKIFHKILPFEQKLEKLDEKAHYDRIETFKNYIEASEEDLEEEYVQVLYERMVTACCLSEAAWKSYIAYVHSRPNDWKPISSNKSKLFLQTDLDIVNRGLRNCTWSGDLFIEKMRIIERSESEAKVAREEIQKVLEKACAIQYKKADPLVKVWIEYLTYLTRVTNFEDESEREILRKNFNLSWNTLGWSYGNLADCDCEILKFWSCVEYERFKDANQGKQLFNTVMESNENYSKTSLWIEFAQLEHQYRGCDAARLIFKRALKVHDLNDLPGMVSYWIRYERYNGTLENLKYCEEVCEKAMKQNRRKLPRKPDGNVRKEQNDKRTSNEGSRKRKFEDNHSSDTHHQKKQATTVSREDFQKLSISRSEKKEERIEIDESKDSVRIFLSNLGYGVKTEDLREAFPEISIVDFEMITSKEGKRLGYGYCELATEDDVKKALEFDRRLMAGRPVFISKCERDKSRRQTYKYSSAVEPNKLFIKGLSFETTPADLGRQFKEFGTIKDIRVIGKKNGQSKGIAYIEFEDDKSASRAVMKMNDTQFMGRTISVAISAPPVAPQDKSERFQPQPSNSKPSHKPSLRTAPESKLSFVPTSVRKAVASATDQKKTETPAIKSNSDFRKMFLK